MARIARVVIPGCPHHVIQRGNRCQTVFFYDSDKRFYISLLHKYAKKTDVNIWAYCLMDNHVHLIAVPKHKDSLVRGIGETHRRYTLIINSREKWKGYLWQGRFISYPLDEGHFYAAVRYIECNPIRTGLVKRAEDYPWSSAKSHILKENDILISDDLMISKINDWSSYLREGERESDIELFRLHARTGRPLGDEKFLSKLEKTTGRILKRRRPGPKKNN